MHIEAVHIEAVHIEAVHVEAVQRELSSTAAPGEIRVRPWRTSAALLSERDTVHHVTRLDTNDAALLPISTDQDIEHRVAGLLQRAIRRQWWTLYLDADDRQRPVLMPMARYPAHPHEPCGDEGTAAEVFANRLASIVAEIGAAKVIFVWERPGDDELTGGDRAWAGALGSACRDAGVAVRAQLVLHDTGVRWIAAEEPERPHAAPGSVDPA